jgi:hypothetical protein
MFSFPTQCLETYEEHFSSQFSGNIVNDDVRESVRYINNTWRQGAAFTWRQGAAFTWIESQRFVGWISHMNVCLFDVNMKGPINETVVVSMRHIKVPP